MGILDIPLKKIFSELLVFIMDLQEVESAAYEHRQRILSDLASIKEREEQIRFHFEQEVCLQISTHSKMCMHNASLFIQATSQCNSLYCRKPDLLTKKN